MLVHECQASVEAVFGQEGIGIEQEDVLGPTFTHGLVVGPGETNILRVGDEAYLWEVVADPVEAVVARLIIDYPHLCLYST